MDSVRFGRALGVGARAAAKTLAAAADAATAPNPSANKPSSGPSASPSQTQPRAQKQGTGPGVRLGETAARTTRQVHQTGEGIKRGGKRFGEAVWGPLAKLSGQLWLELTGVFFGIFAIYAISNAWKLRGNMHETPVNHDEHVHLLILAVMAITFSYFCVSSFVRSSRRGKRR